MKRFLAITLGILTAIGGFVDIGNLVANAETGARFRMSLAWVIVLGVAGIIVFAEMSGRVAAVSGRAVFDLVRERLGARVGLANLVASMAINLLTLTAEIAGVALALQLASSVNYLLWMPLVAFLVWIVIWRVQFETMERIFGLVGLTLVVFGVALVRAHPQYSHLLHSATHPSIPRSEGAATYLYFAIAQFGAAMTPYEVFFFSSGAVEEHWTEKDLTVNRANVWIGFILGGILCLLQMAITAVVFAPRSISVGTLSQVALPVVAVMGKLGLALLLIGIFAATFGAALETALSSGYTISQYFGWQWGKFVAPKRASRFHLVTMLAIVFGVLLSFTTVDPIKVTEFAIVLSAAALPLTYFPILVVANDPDYMGDKVNSKVMNFVGSMFFVVLVVIAVATIPLMIITKAGA